MHTTIKPLRIHAMSPGGLEPEKVILRCEVGLVLESPVDVPVFHQPLTVDPLVVAARLLVEVAQPQLFEHFFESGHGPSVTLPSGQHLLKTLPLMRLFRQLHGKFLHDEPAHDAEQQYPIGQRLHASLLR